jgi:hypothetical protein
MKSKQLQQQLKMRNKKIIVCIWIGWAMALNCSTAQNWSDKSVKLQGINGGILRFDKIKELVKNPVTGAELSLEFQTLGEKEWHQFQNFPVVGLGAVWLDLGNPEKLGDAFALYPYFNTPLFRSSFFNLYLKAGAGVSYLTKTYYNTNKDAEGKLLSSLSGTNAAIGSSLNVYFAGGAALDVPLTSSVSATAEYTWNHMSNGSTVAPNAGLNLMNGFLGLKYFPKNEKCNLPIKQRIPDLPCKYAVELIASGGFRELYYQDNKTFPIASITLAVLRPITNYYRMGLGVDAFYDPVFGEVNSAVNAVENETKYGRTYIVNDELKNKFRVGLSWQHELMFGRLIAGIHLGLYLYNPIKNLEPYTVAKSTPLNKSLFYPYNIEKEDGWLYTRAALKYALTNQLFLSLGLKTHYQKAEFIEWGVGCRL